MIHSLQELKRQQQLPTDNDPVWKFVHLAQKGKNIKAKGRYLLTRSGFLDHNTGEWTLLGKLALQHAAEKQRSEKNRQRRRDR